MIKALLIVLIMLFNATAFSTPQTDLSVIEIKNMNRNSIVAVYSYDRYSLDYSFYQGTGFIVNFNGTIVTNYHVVQNELIAVKLWNGEIITDVKLVWYDQEIDYALLRVDRNDLSPVNLGNSDNIQTGEKIVVIGNPEGLDYTVSDGLISNIHDSYNSRLIQISAPVSHGSSGSPVFNMKGEVIGIVTFMLKEGQLLNFAIPINVIKSKVDTTDYSGNKYGSELYYINEGNKANSNMNTLLAIDYFEKALELNPNSYEAYAGLGAAYRDNNMYDKSMIYYNKAIDINDNYYSVYLGRGCLYYIIGEYDKAIKDFSKAIQLNPLSRESYFDRGGAYCTIDKFDEGIEDLTRAISIMPNLFTQYESRGRCYLDKGNYEEAINDFNKAIELDPMGLSHNDVYLMRGIAYVIVGDYSYQAIYDFMKYIESQPDYNMRQKAIKLIVIDNIHIKSEDKKDILKIIQKIEYKMMKNDK